MPPGAMAAAAAAAGEEYSEEEEYEVEEYQPEEEETKQEYTPTHTETTGAGYEEEDQQDETHDGLNDQPHATHTQPNNQNDSPPPTAHAQPHTQKGEYTDAYHADPSVPPATPAPAPSGAPPSSSAPASAVTFDLSDLDGAAHAAIESDDQQVVSQLLQILEQHRFECEKKSMYIEAELVTKKIEQLRQHEESRRVSFMSVRHLEERLSMEEAHLLEFDEFNRVWADQIFLEFDRVTNEKQQAMLVRHVEELEQWTIDEQERVLLRPKFSKQLLQLRTLQESFARVKDYASAERIKVQADSLMSFELSSLKAQWSAAISSKRHRFIDKQRKELAAYLGRRSDERNKLELRKRHELKSEIIQKYKNLQSELDLAHAKERNQAQKFRELGVSGSVILREQAPRNRNPTRASGVDAWRNDQNRPTPVAPTQQKATLGRTRLVSTGMRQRQAQAQSRRTESADSVDGAYSPRPPSTPGFVSSSSSAIPTIASSLDHHSSRPGTGTVDSSSPHAIATPARQTYAHTQQIYTTRPATSHAYDASGRHPIVRRTPQVLDSALHYSRPPTRAGAGTSVDRARELDAILAGPPSHRTAASASTRPPQPTYVDRMAARRTTSQKSITDMEAFLPKPPLPAIAQARAIQAQKQAFAEERRRKQAAEREAQLARATKSASDDDEF